MPRKNANGRTWQSIAKWGENNEFNKEQLTAFKTIAAMYVLSFYDEAIVEAITDGSYNEFVEKEEWLVQIGKVEYGNQRATL
jgi:hypothetical protein